MDRLRIRIVGVVVPLILLVGCSSEPQATSPTPARRTPIGSASPSAGITAVDFHCRLPVLLKSTNIATGWLMFPTGEVQTDPSADSTARSYNWRFNKWVPVPAAWQSADGSQYAYVGADNTAHVVDLATGRDTPLPRARDLAIIGFDGGKVYAARASGSELWRIDPFSGAVVQVLSNGTWVRVGHGNAWGHTFSELPLVRADLSNAGTELWYTRGPVVNIFGMDQAGRPVVEVGPRDGRGGTIMVVLAVDQGDIISPADTPPNPVIFDSTWSAPVDSHGVWLAASDGIHLVVPAAVPFMIKVSDVQAVPVGACN